jgi:ABC-type glycerol-3-phosphate transport system substrate-binding protein
VGDETAGYSDIITAFKAKNGQYANTDIRFTKFASYADYEQTLLNVMADGNGPDIFVVNNNGGTLLENKMIAIPGSVINTDDFSKRFARVFDELILSNKEKNEK